MGARAYVQRVTNHAPNPPPPAYPAPSSPPRYPTAPTPHQVASDDWITRQFRARQPASAAPATALVLCLIAALFAAVLLPDGMGGLGVSLFAVLAVAGLMIGAALRTQALIILGVTCCLAVVMMFRESGLLRLGLTALVAGTLLVAAIVAKRGSLFDVSIVQSTLGVLGSCIHALLTPAWLFLGSRAATSTRRTINAAVIARIGLLTLPVLVLIAALLSSADAFFASLFAPDVTSLIVWGFFFTAGGLVFAALLRTATVGMASTSVTRCLRVSRLEVAITLGGIALLLAAFVVIQILSEMATGRDSLAARGISYADYARSGYIQLLVVVGLVTVILASFDRLGRDSDGRTFTFQRVLAAVIVALAMAVVGVALRRLALYCEAYGLTMLRLACVAGAVWFAIVLMMLAARLLGIGETRNWLPGATGLALVAVTLTFAVINPQRVVVEYDLDRAATIPLDLRYLTSLSSDAVPTLVTRLGQLSPPESDYVLGRLCPRYSTPVSWTQINLSHVSAQRALDGVCPR
jgi:hypothetical protein